MENQVEPEQIVVVACAFFGLGMGIVNRLVSSYVAIAFGALGFLVVILISAFSLERRRKR
jgi:hypothetical protein